MNRLALLFAAGAFLLASTSPALAAGGSFQIAPGPPARAPVQITGERPPDIDHFGPGLMDLDRPVFHFCGPGPQSLVCDVVGASVNFFRTGTSAFGPRRVMLPSAPMVRRWDGRTATLILP